MFKIKGSCEIRIVDSRTGKVKQVLEKENLITNGFLHSILEFNPRGWFDSFAIGSSGYETYIIISANTATPVINGSPSVMAQAYTPSGVTKKTFYPNANPIYGQLQQRIDFTGTDRTFQTVGLREGRTGLVQAYLLLDTPCIQGAFDYLDLFYRVQFINDGGEGLPEDALLDFARQSFAAGFFSMSNYAAWVGAMPASNSLYNRYASALSLQNRFNGAPLGSLGGSVIHNHYKYKMTNSFGQNTVVGFILGCITQGNGSSGGYYTIKNVVNPNAPFQSIFTHSANATVPFFDSLATAGGSGKIRTSGNWTGKFPELYKITIVQGGAVGTATYKYSVRKHLGFDGNSYSDLTFNSPYRIDLPGFHGMKEEDNDLLRWSNTQIVQYDQTGVMLLDVFDGSYKIWDTTTTPALPVTQLRQCAVDATNQKIYAACRVTGLWVIDVANNAVAQPLTNPCYGVDVGRNAIAYAVVENGLYRSSDWSTPLPFTYAGITDNNWSKAYFLKADPEHLEDRLAIVMQPPTAANRRIVWFPANRQTDTNSPPSSLNYYGAVASDAPIYYWRLGEASGTTAADSVGTNTGTYIGNCSLGFSSSILPDTNKSVFFDGGTARISTAFQHTGLQVFTLEARFRTTANVFQGIIGFSGNQSITVANHDRQVYLDSTGKVNFRVFNGNPQIITSNNSYNDGKWHSVVATLSGSGQLLYVDGVLVASRTTVISAENYTGYWHIAYAPGVANYFNGYLDEVAVYNKGLSASRVLEHHNNAYDSSQGEAITAGLPGVESTNIKPWPASLDVSDIGGFWACGAGRLGFAGAGLSSLGGTLVTSITYTHSIYGSDTYYKIAYYNNQHLILRDRIVDPNGSTVNTFADLHVNVTSNVNDFQSSILHLDSGIAIMSRRLRQLFTDNAYCYSNYGWNGNNWELNHPGAKATHNNAQLLGNGINIRFENGANAPHFVATDFYTQSICYGKHKDNASTISHSSAWYSRPAKFDYPVQTGLTVPTQPSNPEPPPTKHWRVKNLVSATGGDGQWIVRELVFRDKAGNVISLTGGTANASASVSTARLAFDGNTGTFWNGAGLRVVNGWLQYSFANPAVVYGLTINQLNNGSNVPPISFALEYSLDEINWTLANNFQISGNADNTAYTFTGAYNTNYEVTLSVALDPSFITIEVDSPELTKLTLNGQPLAAIYTESVLVPAPNEAVIFGNGRVKFNAADSAKTVGGTYAWIKS